MNQEDILTSVTDYTDNAHGNQLRKYSSERYIVHPIEVMKICSHYTDNTVILCAALLHDVLEDTETSKEEVYSFLSTILNEKEAKQTIGIVVELTDVYTKDAYPQFNRKIRKEKEHQRLSQISSEAQTIKYADLISNSVNIVQHDSDFGPKFLTEAHDLMQKINKGNEALYILTLETIKNCLLKLSKDVKA